VYLQEYPPFVRIACWGPSIHSRWTEIIEFWSEFPHKFNGKLLTSSGPWNSRRGIYFLLHRKKQRSHGGMSGEYGGCGNLVTWELRNSGFVSGRLWTSQLSKWLIVPLIPLFSGMDVSTSLVSWRTISQKYWLFIFCPFGNGSGVTRRCPLKINVHIDSFVSVFWRCSIVIGVRRTNF
jgi:hypothetical protein